MRYSWIRIAKIFLYKKKISPAFVENPNANLSPRNLITIFLSIHTCTRGIFNAQDKFICANGGKESNLRLNIQWGVCGDITDLISEVFIKIVEIIDWKVCAPPNLTTGLLFRCSYNKLIFSRLMIDVAFPALLANR